MFLLGMLLFIFVYGVGSSLPSPFPPNCLEAGQACLADPECEELYQTLELCASDQVVSPLGAAARMECLEALSALHRYRPLLACKCHRGMRREEHCLRVYWSLRFLQGDDDLETSPYEDLPVEMSHMASIVAASFLPLDGQNQCLKAAQDCGLYEKCGALRSEYVLACTKRTPGVEHCNRQKCHRALRRFLERVPAEYSLSVLFCPCTDTLCGERRRKTIVPSCSYRERDGLQPNCLHLQGYCRREELCRSRLADFQQNCQPSSSTPSGCARESGAVCLKAYAGLIGTSMTPNYINNQTMKVSLWCNCDDSGNQWQDCLRIQQMFTNNPCLANSISSMGTFPLPVESTPPLPAQETLEELSNNLPNLPQLNTVEEEEEEEEPVREEEEEVDLVDVPEERRQFDMLPGLYTEKATVANLGSGGAAGASAPPLPLLLPLLLPSFVCLRRG